MNKGDIPELFSEPIKQQAWHIQYKTIRKKITTRFQRPIDEMSMANIAEMYKSKTFLCDSCGKELGGCNYTLEDHVLHLIDPRYYWSCGDCIQDDFRNGRVIAMSEG
jgi:transcription initiation factor IIE alpha subunit